MLEVSYICGMVLHCKTRFSRPPHCAKTSILAIIFALLVALCSGTISQAGDRAKPTLVMFETAHCPWCAQWERDIGGIFEKTAEGRMVSLRRVDLTAPRPADLKNISGVTYTPTFVLWDDEREIGRITGYAGETFFWWQLEQLLQKLP
ncbi:MAG: thioredoxin fold domain-containing protein [Magnetospiraceae bacterium]